MGSRGERRVPRRLVVSSPGSPGSRGREGPSFAPAVPSGLPGTGGVPKTAGAGVGAGAAPGHAAEPPEDVPPGCAGDEGGSSGPTSGVSSRSCRPGPLAPIRRLKWPPGFPRLRNRPCGPCTCRFVPSPAGRLPALGRARGCAPTRGLDLRGAVGPTFAGDSAGRRGSRTGKYGGNGRR